MTCKRSGAISISFSPDIFSYSCNQKVKKVLYAGWALEINSGSLSFVMETNTIESRYPLNFREGDAKALGEHLRHRDSVELVGAKRVGISNFLRFFLYHPGVVSKYINHGEKHLFVPVDLNDLVEAEIFPFWILTFKRLVDVAEKQNLGAKVEKELSNLFLDAIQSREVFLTVDNLRKGLLKLIEAGILPTIFFLRFDRIESVVNHVFFANLVGLKEACVQKMAYVFTSFRALDEIAPNVFSRKLLSVFSYPMFIKPARPQDTGVIFENFEANYKFDAPSDLKGRLIEICGGHIQYLQLCLIVLNQKTREGGVDFGKVLNVLTADERINLQSEEIWESLTETEQQTLLSIHQSHQVTSVQKESAAYLWNTGLVFEKEKKVYIFSPLFEFYLANHPDKKVEAGKTDLTKKENKLFQMLLANRDQVCEREKIIETVWPEVSELGVSDWTIDRLVARLRTKLKNQKSEYSVVTVKTRGYKLTG